MKPEPRRINVYVPRAMREEMEARPDINYSKVAQAAFAAELAKPRRDILDIASKKGH